MVTDAFKSLGKMCYKYLSEKDESLELLRIVGLGGNDVYVKVIESEDKSKIANKEKVKFETLCEEYTFLSPDGVITFSDVNVGTRNTDTGNRLSVSDVIIAQYRTSDMLAGNTEPWVVCRQNITDLYSQMLVGSVDDALVGMSSTKASMPAGIDYEIMMACEGMNKSIMVNFYLPDTLEDILSIIKTQPFDNILEANLIDHIRSMESKLNRKLRLKPGTKSVDGYCVTLEQLLKENNFWYDVEQGLNIISLDKVIETNEDNSLTEDLRYIISTILKQPIASSIVIKYDMDIDLEEFKNSKYILIRDANKDLYVIGYTTLGEYIEPDMENEQIKKEIESIMGLIPLDNSKYFVK